MRWFSLTRLGSLMIVTALASCEKSSQPAALAAMPSRKPGLWEQKLVRDGRTGMMGAMKMCVDASADRGIGLLGRRLAAGDCRRAIHEEGPGAYRFDSTCRPGDGSVVIIRGVATGDFASSYHVRSDIDVTGAPIDMMNGAHEVEVTARFMGPCPSGMRPGDVQLGSGLKVNIDHLPRLAGVIEGG